MAPLCCNMGDLDSAEELEACLNNSINDGPFGPVEFKAYIHKNCENYELFISHLKVHKEYRRQGRAHKSVKGAAKMCSESNISVSTVSIDIINRGGAESFLKKMGFANTYKHGEQISGETTINNLICST